LKKAQIEARKTKLLLLLEKGDLRPSWLIQKERDALKLKKLGGGEKS